MDKVIISTLLYFDMFKYPLTEEEIFLFNKRPTDKVTISESLKVLLSLGIVHQLGEFYALRKDWSIVENRLDANRRAEKKMKTARNFCKIIASFPFVQAVMLSGSISKGVMYSDSDIDYFIIAKKNRLWITKLLLTLFKKIFLLNSYKNFCINYFITENALEIEEKNYFTATEIVTLIPVYGYDLYLDFIKENDWVKSYYANYPLRTNRFVVSKKRGAFKTLLRLLFDNRWGDFIDNWFMNFTWNRYLKKYKNSYGEEAVRIAFKSNPNTSKVHPSHYQRKFLEKYQEKVRKFELENSIQLNVAIGLEQIIK